MAKNKKRNMQLKTSNKSNSQKSQSSNIYFTGELPYQLTNDFFFKVFLERNETALRGLLCALLSIQPEEIVSVTVTNPIELGDSADDKDMILDVKVLLNSLEIINIEMQVHNLGNWPERSLTYLCRMFDQLKKGEEYKTVKKTIHISITNFTPDGFPEVLYSDYFLYNLKTKHKYSDKFGIYMLQLNQLGNPEDEKNIPDIYHWAQLFKAKTWEEIQMLAQKNDVIQQSIHTLQELTADEKMQMRMEARDRYHKDFAAAVDYQKQKIQQQLDTLQVENAEKDQDILALRAENAEKDQDILTLQMKNAEKDQDILALQAEIAEFKERFRVLEEQIAKSQKE